MSSQQIATGQEQEAILQHNRQAALDQADKFLTSIGYTGDDSWKLKSLQGVAVLDAKIQATMDSLYSIAEKIQEKQANK
jgi:hypothetical protein